MKRSQHGRLTPITVAVACLSLIYSAESREAITEPNEPTPAPAPVVQQLDLDGTTTARFNGPRGFDVEVQKVPMSGSLVDLLGRGADYGKWLCRGCDIQQANPQGLPGEQRDAVLDGIVQNQPVVELNPGGLPEQMAGPFGGFKPGDQATICNGVLCVTIQMQKNGTWAPKDGQAGFVPDVPMSNGRNASNTHFYRNPGGGFQVPNDRRYQPDPDPRKITPIVMLNDGWQWIPVIYLDGFKRCCVTTPGSGDGIIPPYPTVTADASGHGSGDYAGNYGGDFGAGAFGGGDVSGGGWDGNSCVHVETRLPDGRRAGDIKAGDWMQLGDEGTPDFATRTGLVTHSHTARARGLRITTQSGISLVCSDSAPIWTEHGYVKAPELKGKRVATRIDRDDVVTTRYEVVEVVEDVGMIDVQVITVGDRAFWAGEKADAYLLHHNLKVAY